jgi:hypothetical protein
MLILVLVLVLATKASAFGPASVFMRSGPSLASTKPVLLSMGPQLGNMAIPFLQKASLILADTSISEEDVLAYTGTTSDLPNPLWGVGFAFVVFAGVAVLQFSLGDLTKEEGQARVRDYLQTKNDTERKRGYFD